MFSKVPVRTKILNQNLTEILDWFKNTSSAGSNQIYAEIKASFPMLPDFSWSKHTKTE
jgi:hypothetical protein